MISDNIILDLEELSQNMIGLNGWALSWCKKDSRISNWSKEYKVRGAFLCV